MRSGEIRSSTLDEHGTTEGKQVAKHNPTTLTNDIKRRGTECNSVVSKLLMAFVGMQDHDIAYKCNAPHRFGTSCYHGLLLACTFNSKRCSWRRHAALA